MNAPRPASHDFTKRVSPLSGLIESKRPFAAQSLLDSQGGLFDFPSLRPQPTLAPSRRCLRVAPLAFSGCRQQPEPPRLASPPSGRPAAG